MRKLFLQGSVHKLTSQLEKAQQQMANFEATWKETFKHKEAAIAKLTSEKESLEKEVAQLKKNQVWWGSGLNNNIRGISSLHVSCMLLPTMHIVMIVLNFAHVLVSIILS